MAPGVNVICDAEHLVEHFGSDAFDVIVSTEMLEHTRNWREVVTNLKRVTKPNGIIVLTTRSPGFPLHGYPYDFWRYDQSDMRVIFGTVSSRD